MVKKPKTEKKIKEAKPQKVTTTMRRPPKVEVKVLPTKQVDFTRKNVEETKVYDPAIWSEPEWSRHFCSGV